MLNEISQVVKEKYHMISLISASWSTKQTSKQNINRKTEIKNTPALTRGVGEEDSEEKKGDNEDGQGTCIKDTWTNPKWVGLRMGGGGGWGEQLGENGNNWTWKTIKDKINCSIEKNLNHKGKLTQDVLSIPVVCKMLKEIIWAEKTDTLEKYGTSITNENFLE